MTRYDVLASPQALSSHRQASWHVTLLTRTGQEIGPLQGVEGGSVTVSSTTRLRGSGTLQVRDLGQHVDWLSDRVRLTYQITGGPAWDLGVFLMAAPKTSHTATGTSRQVELTGLLAVLDEDTTTSTHEVPAGTIVTDHVRQLIVATGERAAVTPSPTTTPAPLMWDPGTPTLTVANDLLETIGYSALDVDEHATIQAHPYTPPAQRPVAWAFQEGALAVHAPTWGRSQDLASVPNRVVLVSAAGADSEPMVSTASNDDPDSPWGYQARGRWVTHTQTGVEAATQEVLDSLAQRRLVSLSSPSATVEGSCLPLPLRPLDAVTWGAAGGQVRAVVQEVSVSLSPTALMSVKLREVVS